jgi:hypothetical protein
MSTTYQDKAIDITSQKDVAMTLNTYFEEGWVFVEYLRTSVCVTVIVRKLDNQIDTQKQHNFVSN